MSRWTKNACHQKMKRSIIWIAVISGLIGAIGSLVSMPVQLISPSATSVAQNEQVKVSEPQIFSIPKLNITTVVYQTNSSLQLLGGNKLKVIG